MTTDLYHYAFPFLTELSDPIIRLISLGIECQIGPGYYYDNKERMLNGYLFQYTISGSGILCIGDREYEILPSHALFIPIPSDTRYYCNTKKQEPWKFMYILVQSTHMEEYYQLIIKKASNILTLSKDSAPVQCLLDIINQTKNGHITNFCTASSLAFDFMNRLYYHYMNNSENYSKRNREIIHYINNNFASINGIETIAELYHISASHLSREFTSDTGITLIKYLTEVRILHAKKLLQTTLLPVSEVSRRCGYSQTNYFCKVFKENVGQTPLQYRNCVT
ncbi:MAG: AraC family transcriptional regulator [Lachnospiraceae bacterium]